MESDVPDHSVSGVDRARGGGAGVVADQTGDVVLSSGGWRIETRCRYSGARRHRRRRVLAWSILRGVWRTPQRITRARRERRHARGRHAITHELLAIGHGDSTPPATMPMSRAAMPGMIRWRCCCTRNPHSSTATAKARERLRHGRTRGHAATGPARSFIEAQRADDHRCRHDREALKLAPASTWASHAVLGFRCAKADTAARCRSSTTIWHRG
jgi:HemY protein